MDTSLTIAPMRSGLHYYLEQQFNSFHNFPIETDLDNLNADVAILGIPFGDPYSMGELAMIRHLLLHTSVDIAVERYVVLIDMILILAELFSMEEI